MKNVKIYALVLAAVLATPQKSEAQVLDFLFGAGSFGRKAGTTADCRNLYQRFVQNSKAMRDTTWKDRVVYERNPNFLFDNQYADEEKFLKSTLGIMDTKFDKEFDTRIYYTATAKPNPDGSIPVVDPEAKALIIYLHGSGTKKASGAGWAVKANALAKLGYGSLSFDLPFHADGSRNPALNDTATFMEYMKNIIEKYRVPGQKVILAGHSFGPDLILEFITRYPQHADAVAAISPAGWDKELEHWYTTKTSAMDFGDTETNDDGGRWAGLVMSNRTWNDPVKKKSLMDRFAGSDEKRVDPTVANPNLRIMVVSGDQEEYIPGPLGPDGKPTKEPRTYDVEASIKKIFDRVEVVIEPGVGHYIFAHKDKDGYDVVQRTILALNNETPANEKEYKKQVTDRNLNKPEYDIVALRFQKEPFFRNYLNMIAKEEGTTGIEIVRRLIKNDDKAAAKKLLSTYATIEKQRLDVVYENIRATKDWAPRFYRENKEAIDAIGTKGKDQTAILVKYYAFIEKLYLSNIKRYASATPDVYKVKENAPVDKQKPQDNRPVVANVIEVDGVRLTQVDADGKFFVNDAGEPFVYNQKNGTAKQIPQLPKNLQGQVPQPKPAQDLPKAEFEGKQLLPMEPEGKFFVDDAGQAYIFDKNKNVVKKIPQLPKNLQGKEPLGKPEAKSDDAQPAPALEFEGKPLKPVGDDGKFFVDGEGNAYIYDKVREKVKQIPQLPKHLQQNQ